MKRSERSWNQLNVMPTKGQNISDWAIMLTMMALVCLPTVLAFKDVADKKRIEQERRESLWTTIGEESCL